VGTRGDLQSGRSALYEYLLATEASLGAFEPEWSRTGFGSGLASRYQLLDCRLDGPQPAQSFRLLGPAASRPEFSVILRMHSWCAAFVDWCVLQLLLRADASSGRRRGGTRGPGGRAPDLAERQFRANGSDQLWVADLPYLPTWARRV